MLEAIAREVVAAHAGARLDVVVEEQYRNMHEVLESRPEIADYARDAIRRAGLEPRSRPIRGGTDGSKLSFMGLPTPNIFAGEHNFHSRLEWVSVQDMEKAVDVVIELSRIWEERS
jgi:tripeptide aminopeptidase